VRAKTRRQTITPDGTPGLHCLSNPGRRQTAIFLLQGVTNFDYRGYRNLVLCLPRLAVLVSIEAD
jgi:hypothetical protein